MQPLIFTSCGLGSERSEKDENGGNLLRLEKVQAENSEGPNGDTLQVNPSLTKNNSTNVPRNNAPCHATGFVRLNIR